MSSRFLKAALAPSAALISSIALSPHSMSLQEDQSQRSNTPRSSPINHTNVGYVRPNDPGRFKTFDERWAAVAYNETGPELKKAHSEFEHSDEWIRIDDVRYRRDGHAGGYRNHAIADSLAVRSGAITAYRMYLRRDGSEVAVVAQCARGTDGHSGILHGGVTALLFDEATGWMNACSRLQESGKLTAFTDPANPTPFPVQPKEASKLFGFTAFLHVNYRSPVFLAERSGEQSTVVVLRAKEAKKEGRKVFLKAGMFKQAVGAKRPRLLADAEALYVLPRSE